MDTPNWAVVAASRQATMTARAGFHTANKMSDLPHPPLITAGITCYNAADTISRAVHSARRQTWPNKEIIVVDDASTDQSSEVLGTLAEDYPDIRVIRHRDNRGLAGAENTILSEAQGHFIALFDDDDESIPERLELQYRRIINYERLRQSTLVFCYSNRLVIPRKGGSAHIANAIGRKAPEPNGAVVADYLFGDAVPPDFVWGLFGSCTLMARRDSFLLVGAFDEAFRRCAEWDLAVRAALRGAHFIAVNEPLVTTYKTLGLDKTGDVSLKYALQLRSKHKAYLAKRKIYWASRAIAHHHFHGTRGRRLRSGVFFVMACLASPTFLLRWVRSRFKLRKIELERQLSGSRI